MTYDSAPDTLRHSLRVGQLLAPVLAELAARSVSHDGSKLEEPELSTYNEFVPLLANAEYGTPEYRQLVDAMGEGLAHHYAANPHHPEHYDDGVDGMTLVDLIEMLADWRAASERRPDGTMAQSIARSCARFRIGHQLESILRNTARAYGWSKAPD
jgi:hypothetical protein